MQALAAVLAVFDKDVQVRPLERTGPQLTLDRPALNCLSTDVQLTLNLTWQVSQRAHEDREVARREAERRAKRQGAAKPFPRLLSLLHRFLSHGESRMGYTGGVEMTVRGQAGGGRGGDAARGD